jgi:two-component system, chemotaxis family, CheB/CheR fusion protein
MARILIVEDDRPFADALTLALRPEGHEIAVALTAEQGIKLGLSRPPDVVIADWKLGGELHGGEVCRRLRAACPRLRAIVVTGYPDTVSEEVETLLLKPFHKEAILEAVARELSARECEEG